MGVGKKYIERYKKIQTGKEKSQVNIRHRSEPSQAATKSTSEKASYQKSHRRSVRKGVKSALDSC